MDGKKYFRGCCKDLGIDCGTFIKLGAGDPKDAKRFLFQCGHTKRKPSQLFAVKYFGSEDVYIAWSLREPKAKMKDVFSLSKRKIEPLRPGQVLAIEKGIGYPAWDTETVFAVKPDAVPRFLEVYVAPRI